MVTHRRALHPVAVAGMLLGLSAALSVVACSGPRIVDHAKLEQGILDQ